MEGRLKSQKGKQHPANEKDVSVSTPLPVPGACCQSLRGSPPSEWHLASLPNPEEPSVATPGTSKDTGKKGQVGASWAPGSRCRGYLLTCQRLIFVQAKAPPETRPQT